MFINISSLYVLNLKKNTPKKNKKMLENCLKCLKTFKNFFCLCLYISIQAGRKTTKMSTALQTFAPRAINLDKLLGWQPGLPPTEIQRQDSTPPSHPPPSPLLHTQSCSIYTPSTSSVADQTKLTPLSFNRLKHIWSADQSAPNACKIKTVLAAKQRNIVEGY